MSEPFDFSAYGAQFRRTAAALFSSSLSAADVAGNMHLLTTAVERDLARFGESDERSLVACAPGCGTCCVLNVSVLLPEIVAIGRFLEKRLDVAAFGRLRERLAELRRRVHGLDDEERIFLRQPCAFLDEQARCMVHPVRPLLCRSVTSIDPVSCRGAVTLAPLEDPPLVVMNLFQKQLMEVAFCALGQALKDNGLDDRPRHLGPATHAYLQQPEVVGRFLAGEAIPR